VDTFKDPSKQTGLVRLGIVDNDPLTLQMLVSIMPRLAPNCEVIWYTDSADSAIRKSLDGDIAPEMLLSDISFGNESEGLRICKEIRRKNSSIKILLMTSFSLNHYGEEAIRSGAQGLVLKADMSMISLGINKVSRGGTFSPLEGALFETPSQSHERLIQESEPEKPKLSKQEAEIIDALSKGRRYSEIADDFGVTQSSIRTQARRAVKKMKAATLQQAVAMWVIGKRE
jgi:DNA-binding NarL/FixJ family response regulator